MTRRRRLPAIEVPSYLGHSGTETVEQGAREAVRVALLCADGPTGTFTRREGEKPP